jgi:hypothetical protein
MREEAVMERRTFLTGSAAAAVGLSSRPAGSQSPPVAGQPLAPTDLMSEVARLRSQFLREFDPAYVDNVIVPHFLVSTYQGERLSLPMIDVKLTKENALPYDLWGLISETWRPSPENGVTVFLQALEKRGSRSLTSPILSRFLSDRQPSLATMSGSDGRHSDTTLVDVSICSGPNISRAPDEAKAKGEET